MQNECGGAVNAAGSRRGPSWRNTCTCGRGRVRRVAARLVLVLALALPSVWALDEPADGVFHVRIGEVPLLVHGVGTRDGFRSGADICLQLIRRDGLWDESVWCYTTAWRGGGERLLRLDEPARTRLSLELALPDFTASEATVLAGEDEPLDLTVLLRSASSGWEAAFHGHQGQETFAGTGRVDVFPLPESDPAHEPAVAGAHPRLAFGPAAIPELRQHIGSGQGEAIMRRLDLLLQRPVRWWGRQADAASHAAGHALRYLLQDDNAAAAQARDLVERRMRLPVGGRPLLDSASEVACVALAYDLCHPAWDDAFRRRVATWLEERSGLLLAGFARRAVRSPESHWNAVCRSAAGLAALAVVGDRGQFPQRPSEVVFHRFASAPEIDTGDDVPVARLRDDCVPERWLVVGPFHEAAGMDVLAGIGGAGTARPQAGTTVTFAGQQRVVRQLDEQALWRSSRHNTACDAVLEVLDPIERAYHTTTAYYTVLRVKRQSVFRYALDPSLAAAARSWIGGKPLRPGDLVSLAPGRYPLSLLVEVGETDPWGKIWIAPRFQRVSDEHAQELEAKLARRIEEWQAAHAAWKAAGEPVPTAPERLAAAGRLVRRWLVYGLGDHGFGSEGDYYTALAAQTGVFPFLQAWRRHHGRELHAGDGARWIIPALLQRRQLVDGALVFAPYGRGGRTLADPALLTVGLPSCRSEDRSTVTRLVRRFHPPGDQRDGLGITQPHHAIYALAGLLLPTAQGAIPRALVDHRKGLYTFRNGQADDAVVATIYAKSQPLGGASSFPDAGSFRLLGFGQEWLVRGEAEATRAAENVLLVDGIEAWGGARVRHAEVGDDGSGTVTMEMDRVYRERDGSPLGIGGERLFAVDYSGRCGAPALVTVADEIDGGSERAWRVNTAGHPQVSDKSFTLLGKDGVQLRGTVLLPVDASLTVDGTAVEVTGSGQRYLVVMTLGPGQAPEVVVKDLDQEGITYKVGKLKRRIAFVEADADD